MKRTWKSKVGDILVIIPGAIGVVGGATYAILIVKAQISGSYGPVIVLLPLGLSVLCVGIVAVIGGIYALKRKRWGLLLAGSIFALAGWIVLGVMLPPGFALALFAGAVLVLIAIIVVIIDRRESERRAKSMVGTGFCPACGAPTATQTELCTRCGVRLAEAVKRRTWKPNVGGILASVGGVLGVIAGIKLVTVSGDIGILLIVLPALGLLAVLSGIVAIVGGICALRRTSWRFALAGAICALPAWVVLGAWLPVDSIWILPAGIILGALAIIFVVMAKPEFRWGPKPSG